MELEYWIIKNPNLILIFCLSNPQIELSAFALNVQQWIWETNLPRTADPRQECVRGRQGGAEHAELRASMQLERDKSRSDQNEQDHTEWAYTMKWIGQL